MYGFSGAVQSVLRPFSNQIVFIAEYKQTRTHRPPAQGSDLFVVVELKEQNPNPKSSDLRVLVDPKGIEPSTLRMRTVRSPRLSYGPKSTVPKTEQENKAI